MDNMGMDVIGMWSVWRHGRVVSTRYGDLDTTCRHLRSNLLAARSVQMMSEGAGARLARWCEWM